MKSRLRRQELERRINEATLSGWRPFQSGVSGWARFGHLRLGYRERFTQYTGSPILSGRIDDETGVSRLRLRYRAPLPVYLFFALWYGFLLFLLVSVIADDRMNWEGRAIMTGAIISLALALIGMHYAFTRKANARFDQIVRFLEQVADATIVRGGRRH